MHMWRHVSRDDRKRLAPYSGEVGNAVREQIERRDKVAVCLGRAGLRLLASTGAQGS